MAEEEEEGIQDYEHISQPIPNVRQNRCCYFCTQEVEKDHAKTQVSKDGAKPSSAGKIDKAPGKRVVKKSD
jgi:hypothetical protein